jgi:hypothetical protein
VLADLTAIPFVPPPYAEYVLGAAAIALGALGLKDASRGMRGKGMSVPAILLGGLAIVYKTAAQAGVLGCTGQ